MRYSRIYEIQGDYADASPCRYIDLPQTLLEPILVRHATHHGFKSRFDTRLLSFSQDPHTGHILTTALDTLTNHHIHIRSRYLAGADGARSETVKQLALPLSNTQPSDAFAWNVLFEADLSPIMKHSPGLLAICLQPDRPFPAHGWAGILRMIRPWKEWMFVVFPARCNRIQPHGRRHEGPDPGMDRR